MLALNGHGQGVGMYPSSEVVIDILLKSNAVQQALPLSKHWCQAKPCKDLISSRIGQGRPLAGCSRRLRMTVEVGVQTVCLKSQAPAPVLKASGKSSGLSCQSRQ